MARTGGVTACGPKKSGEESDEGFGLWEAAGVKTVGGVLSIITSDSEGDPYA